MCAQRERETSRSCGSQLQMHNILYLLQAGYTRSTFNSDTQTVVVVINTIRVSALNAHLVYEKHFRGPLAFGALGSRLPLPNG